VPPGRNIGHWSKTAGILPYTDRWSHSPERTLALNCAIHPLSFSDKSVIIIIRSNTKL